MRKKAVNQTPKIDNINGSLSQLFSVKILGILGVIWFIGTVSDRIWLSLDHSVPEWDQADYLNGVLNYWKYLQNIDLFNGDWWRQLWLLSNKIPPLTYIITTPLINLFGTSSDAAMSIMLVFSLLLLLSIYILGASLFSIEVGLLTAGFCQLLPGLYHYRLNFLLDYPLTSIVIFSFTCLTIWKLKNTWLWAVIFGLSLGFGLMIKQTALFFLLFPMLWLLLGAFKDKHWQRIAQLITSFLVSLLVFYPWYRTNWLLMLTSGKRATIDSALAEGDPTLNTLDAWIYYLKILPYFSSWVLLIVPIVGLLIYWGYFIFTGSRKPLFNHQYNPYTWLGIFLIGGYLLSSININKDPRYILPLLPIISLFLVVGLLLGCTHFTKYSQYIKGITIGLAAILMCLNLFPLGGIWLTKILSPKMQFYPYLGPRYPHEKVIKSIIETAPYLKSTLGVLPSTATINQHNFSFYGKQFNSQVSGRQVGVNKQDINADGRSLDWFITKTGDQGSIPESQPFMVARIEQGSDFELGNSWSLPDKSTLKLYHDKKPSLEVYPTTATNTQVKLEKVIIPSQSPPGLPIPVTYEFSGAWQELQSGIVILTWKSQTGFWIHDHGIAKGFLNSGLTQTQGNYWVIEHLAMFPPLDTQAGDYVLEAIYLNRDTGESYPIATPKISLTINPEAIATPAPELDLVTQLRLFAPDLAKGRVGLDPIFIEVARINQYDPSQDYLIQADKALSYRLQQNANLDWVYTTALARVLQQDVNGAIAALEAVIKLAPENPYNYAYLAFVYLYDWRGKAAQETLKPALSKAPDLPELQALSGIAALMQGHIFQGWSKLSQALPEL